MTSRIAFISVLGLAPFFSSPLFADPEEDALEAKTAALYARIDAQNTRLAASLMKNDADARKSVIDPHYFDFIASNYATNSAQVQALYESGATAYSQGMASTGLGNSWYDSGLTSWNLGIAEMSAMTPDFVVAKTHFDTAKVRFNFATENFTNAELAFKAARDAWNDAYNGILQTALDWKTEASLRDADVDDRLYALELAWNSFGTGDLQLLIEDAEAALEDYFGTFGADSVFLSAYGHYESGIENADLGLSAKVAALDDWQTGHPLYLSGSSEYASGIWVPSINHNGEACTELGYAAGNCWLAEYFFALASNDLSACIAELYP